MNDKEKLLRQFIHFVEQMGGMDGISIHRNGFQLIKAFKDTDYNGEKAATQFCEYLEKYEEREDDLYNELGFAEAQKKLDTEAKFKLFP